MSDIKRILVVKLSALGDLFHAVPVVHRLAEQYHCKIDWVTQPEYVDLVACHRDVDRVIAFPRKGGVGASGTFVKQLRIRKYDLALDLQGLTKSGLVMGLCRAERKIGCGRPREASRLFVREIPPSPPDSRHARDILMDSLVYLGLETDPVCYPLAFPAVSGLPATEPPVLALAPKSRWPAKDWPLENFCELAKRVQGDLGAAVWVVGGPQDVSAGDRIVEALEGRGLNLCGRFPLLALGPLLQQVSCLVSNDSGPMHFAAAVGTPLVALFGPTDPDFTGPRGEKVQVLRPDPGAEGYPEHRSYKHGDNRFIARLPVERVFQAVASAL